MSKIFTLLLILFATASFAQKVTLNGIVKDKETGENLIGVNVFDKTTQKGAVSNNYGFYSYTSQGGEVEILFSYVGYDPFIFKQNLTEDLTLHVELTPAHLSEFVVEGSREELIQENTQMGSINVPLRQIKEMPALFGEVDVLKVLQLLPGVQSGTEGASGMYVRGGGPDQNLILLDGVPVYNATHLFGFFSVFNADALNNVELIKGGFPARYGGRLSSVIDINMKEGNMKEFHGAGSIGLIASKLTLEGPIVKDKTSFLLSARRTYIDLLARPFIRRESGGQESAGYYFYDLNAKVNHIFDDKNRLYLSVYGGDDEGYTRSDYSSNSNNERMRSTSETGLGWGNLITAIRWNHIFNKKLFANFSGTYTKYHFRIFDEYDYSRVGNGVEEDRFYQADYRSGIRDYALKADFDYIPNTNHYVRFGANHIFHRFTPGVFTATERAEWFDMEGGDIYDSQEYAVYVEDDIQLGRRVKLNAGLHYSGFMVDGEHYNSLQPRIAYRYLIDESSSVKASFATMTQFIHLLSNAGLGLPTDLWVPATSNIGPQHSWQTSLGYYKSLPGGFELSTEAYYKEMEGLIEYKDGASFLNMGENWEDKVEVGRGRSYGVEMLLQKKVGKTTGWIGYTLSKTERQFENLNRNQWFPFRYDRRHDLSLTVSHHLTPKIHLSGTWVYGTGNAISIPTEIYQSYDDHQFYGPMFGQVEHYDERNNFRMRDYHRLDLGINFIKQKHWGERVWNISIYNAYNRMNPFYMDITFNRQTQQKVLAQYTLFPILPSFSYGFKF
ncbi:TonB-dependent receptor [Litoribacter ruber]|uniref:TonB-dependent receptor n=1 Tax=Litoribacter ruber TaxID=702568 RepID=UPI001BDAC50A|nr:TonB-dependent receptor [Litoribacter ruber]MBT0810549.1 TonB-dependent receptor [Litoribacter ruber]